MSTKKQSKIKEEKTKTTNRQIFIEYSQTILLAVILALFFRSFILQAFYVPSGSMIPTFLEGDRVLVKKFAYGLRNPLTNQVWFNIGAPNRWDVVVFIAPEETNKDFVKRVVGLPGETVSMVEGELFINGHKTPDPYARYNAKTTWASSRSFPPVTMKPGQYFMMGDNRDHSSDSRIWGPVDFSLLKGKAWRLYWSWDSNVESLSQRFRIARVGQKIE